MIASSGASPASGVTELWPETRSATRRRVYSSRGSCRIWSRAELDHLAVPQHHDAVGDLGHHGEIVRDVERRRAVLADQLAERGQHVDLRGHVERGGRLVEDEESGLATIAIAAIARCSWPPDT